MLYYFCRGYVKIIVELPPFGISSTDINERRFSFKGCKMKKTIKQRFIEKVDSNWQWTAVKDSCGYGRMRIKNRMVSAHRLSYEIYKGNIPDGMCVLHSCDDPGCVNPDHLHIGTMSDNAIEREKRGRGVCNKGELHGRSKLTEKQVIEIRKKRLIGLTLYEIANEYGVSKSIISFIANKKNWKHI